MKLVRQVSRLVQSTKAPPVIIHSGAGTCGLPAEIWIEIFKFATTSRNGEHELQFSASSDSILSCGPPSILNTFLHDQRSELFKTRQRIVLVCKSWYIMGISLLYSHVIINLDSHRRRMQSLHDSLLRNPVFASSVVRLSVTGKLYHGYLVKPSRTKENVEIRRLFENIVNRLTQLKIVTCPSTFAHWLNMAAFPQLCILYWGNDARSWCNFDILALNPCFWEHAHTLSFCMSNEPWHAGNYRATPRKVFFPNLVNLRIVVYKQSTADWIARHWIMPKLQALSLSPVLDHYWAPLVSSLSSSLQFLELSISNDRALFQQQPAISMPKLATLCISPSAVSTTRYFIQHISAPNLRQFGLHIYLVLNRAPEDTYPQEDIDEALATYPRLEKIRICHGYGIRTDEVLRASIEEWRQKGLIVEETDSNMHG